jgi:hypothetical protein
LSIGPETNRNSHKSLPRAAWRALSEFMKHQYTRATHHAAVRL